MEKSIMNRSGENLANLTATKTYDMISELNGYAVIINNYRFIDCSKNLDGGADDTRRLEDTFKGLKCIVDSHKNIDADDMQKLLFEYSLKDHKNYNMFVCVLSSHGGMQSILGSDCKSVQVVDLLKHIIDCKSLANKPKLFFIDACRGYDETFIGTPFPKENADYLICYAALEGKSALMMKSLKWKGSYFTKALCDIFRKDGDDKSLDDLLKSLKTAVISSSEGQQTAECIDSLTKTLYFFPESQIRNYTWVAAIDFGTCLSGYALSKYDDYKKDALRIVHKQCWNKSAKNKDIPKTPTCLLLDKNKKLVSFGYDAIEFLSLAELKDQQDDYFLFKNFKMCLYKPKTPLMEMTIPDIQGRHVAASTIFAASLKAIKMKLLDTLYVQDKFASTSEIRWVVTVPAIWPDDARTFMRNAAKEAGIPWDQLVLALEPEAASIYCQHLEIERSKSSAEGFQMFEPGTKYIVLDVGGGTTDITVHEKQEIGVKELDKAGGCGVGGRNVDKAIMEMFDRLFQGLIRKHLKQENPTEYLAIYKEFEDVKKSITSDRTGNIRIPLPCMMLDDYCRKHLQKTLHQVVHEWNDNPKNTHLQICNDKLLIAVDYLRLLFEPSIGEIIKQLSDVVRKNEISLIVLVGGFANCELFSEKVKADFKQKKVIVPDNANLAILKGAVMFGHNSEVINPRITRYTYGTDCVVPFDEYKHDVLRKMTDGWGDECCQGVFSLIIKQKESVPLGKVVKASYYTTEPDQSAMAIKILTSGEDSPLYTNSSDCRCIGELNFNIPKPSKKRRCVAVEYIFGDTEIKIKAVDTKYCNSQECYLNLVKD